MKSRAVQITQIFFYLLAAVWLVTAIAFIGQIHGRWIFSILDGMMFVSVFVFTALGFYITKKAVYWLGVFALAACIVLTIFDDFGIADFVVLILFAIPLVIMLAKRKEFVTAQRSQ